MPYKDKEKKREWREKNKDRVAAQQREWYEKNKEHAKAKRRKWYEANKEREVARVRAWHQKNREHLAANSRTYYQKLPDSVVLKALKASNFPAQHITPELIETRRLSILIKRELTKQVHA